MVLLNLNTFLYLISVLLLTVTIIVLYFKRKFCYWNNKNVYTEPPQIPFGNAYNLVRHKHSHAEEFQKLYNNLKAKNLPYGGYYAFFKPVFIPTDLDLVKNILTNDFDHFTDHIPYVNEEVEPIAANLITLKGLKWKRLRSKLTPAFTLVKMKTMFPTLLNCSKSICNAFEKQMHELGTTDIRDIIARYTTDVIGSCIFGLDCNSLENPEDAFRQVGKKFFDVSTSGNSLIQLLSFLTPGLLASLRVPLVDKYIKETFTKIVKDNIEYREKYNITRNDVLHLLIEMKNHSSSLTENHSEVQLTMNQLTAQCLLFLLAGFETSSNTTTFCLYELASNASIQDKLRREVRETLSKYGEEITYDALAKMTYMDQCIFETLRKYPVVPVSTRECTKAYKVPNSDIFLEKGAYVFIPLLGIHRDPDHYPNPDMFDPERFCKENQATRHACAWIPFGMGPRTCIAEKFGMLQIKVCLSTLLRKYSFTLNSRTEHPLTFDRRSTTILAPNGDVLLNIKEVIE